MRKRKMSLGLIVMTVFLAATPVHGAESKSFYDYYESSFQLLEEEDDDGRTFVSADASSGPGAGAVIMEQSELGDGPAIYDVNLSGRYHKDFDVYEVSMNNQWFLYTNVDNGEITDKPVYIEIPQGLIWRMEWNGTPISYSSGQRVSDHGTYVLHLTAVKDETLPLYRQEEYRAVFRFRIQDRVITETSAADGFAGPGPSVLPEADTELPEETKGMVPIEEDAYWETEAAELTEETEAAEETERAAQEPSAAVSDQNRTEAWIQRYDSGALLYQMSMMDGTSFSANIPEGIATAGIVRIIVNEETAANLYRDDERIEYESGSDLSEPGSYRMEVNGYPWYFEITDSYVNRDFYLAPKNMRVDRAGYEGELLELSSDTYVPMTEDGEYTISLQGNDGDNIQVKLIRDTEAPEIDVLLESGKAYVTYGEEELKAVHLYKNGEALSNVSATLIEEPGEYRITAQDRAGNIAEVTFQLDYVLNSFAVAAIILLCGIAIAAVVFIIRLKRTLTV